MPRGSWRWVVIVAVACGIAARASAAPPPRLPQPAPQTQAPLSFSEPAELPPAAPLPVVPETAPPLKDLTPPGFATEPLPPADVHPAYHDVPGHLNPAAPAGGGPFATAEFLLWRPRRGAFDYVIPGDSTGLVPAGPARSLNYELRTGVRAELGYRLESGWELSAGYTYFRSNAFDSTYAPPGGVLFPTLTRPGLIDTVGFAGADANLEYNTYDAMIGKRYAVDDHLAVRMTGGLRFASIRQGFNAYYDGLDARAATVSARSNFDGFGPIVGGEAVWAGWKGFHLYARATGGMLTGQARNPLVETNDAGRTTYANTAYDIRKVVPLAGAGVGAGWQYRTVSIRVGYEIINYFNLIDQPRFVDDLGPGKFVTRPGNLSLEGLFVQAGLTF